MPISYAPKTEILPDTENVPLVQIAIPSRSKDIHISVKALRNGRGITIVKKTKTDKEFLNSLPYAHFKAEESSEYVPPYKPEILEAGSHHFYKFVITPDFAEATKRYLAGDAEGAMRHIDSILGNPENDPKLLWQSSCMRVDILLIMGKFDLAEIELKRTESLEIKAMGTNHVSRALRAQLRYLTGDFEGAASDAGQIIRSIGSWRFPTFYLLPPSDQLEIGRINTAQVRAQIILGLVLVAKGQWQLALPWFELADQAMNNVMHVATHPFYSIGFTRSPEILCGRGMTLTFLGTTLLALEPESERAREILSRADEYFKAANYKIGPVLVEIFKSQAFIAAKRYRDAEAAASKGIRLAEKLGLFDIIWRIETLRGTALIGLGQWDDAERSFRRASDMIDILAGTMMNVPKIRFGVEKEAITLNLVKINLRKNNITQLFEDIERGRARAFVIQLANKVIATGREESIVSQIRAIDKEILRERQKKYAMSSMEALDINREQALLEKRMSLLATLRERDPDLAGALSVVTVNLKSVQKALPENVVMIYALPAEGDLPLSMLFITKTDAQLKTLSINDRELRDHLNAFNKSIRSGDITAQRAAAEQLREDFDISNWGNVNAVYFVPSENMHFVPWGALDTQFPVSVLPTASWVVRTPPSLSLTTKKAVIIGDPNFGGLFEQLPGARAEAIALSQQYRTAPLIGETATETNLRNQVDKGVDVLHFATHALYDPIYPLQSAIILTDGQKAIPLTAEKLFENPIRSRLVVLSACETGMGHIVDGDDVLGLARSFYLGGASSIVTSLWPVEDETTLMFMEVFHKESQNGNFEQAWIAARNAVRAKGYPPSSYGAFILGGTIGDSSY